MPNNAVVMVSDVSLTRIDAPTTHTIEVARALAAAGLEVDLVARGNDPGLRGVRFHGGGPLRANDPRRVVAVNARAIRVLWRRRRAARALYVREDWATLPAMLTARALGYRVVSEVNDMQYGPGYAYRQPGVRGWLADRVKSAAAGVIWAVSSTIVPVTVALETLIVQNWNVPTDKVRVLPNGVNAAEIRPLDRGESIARAGLDRERRYVVFTGGLVARTAWDTFVAAFDLVARERPWATLLIVGDGPEAPALDALIADRGLEKRALRTGFVDDRKQLNDLLGAATVCLVAHRPRYMARVGASSIKLTEYLAAGRAVVATAIPGLREMIEESGAGIVVPPEDAPAMARAIGELLDDPARADELGAAGRRAVEERWSWEVIGRDIASVLVPES
jgi:glycosyltransferase involved in cell wall biosynthesis